MRIKKWDFIFFNNIMKVAIYLIGQPRYFEETYPNIYKNIIKPNNADVFLHGWFNPEESNKEIKHGGICYYKNRKKGYIIKPNTDKRLIELYKPKKYLIEPQKFLKIKNKKMENVNCTSGLSMYYSIMIANDLVREYENENNFRYDFVVKLRYDMYCDKPLILKNFDRNVFNNPHIRSKEHVPQHIDDRIWFSNSENMYKISRGYLEVEDYIENESLRNKILKKGNKFHTHSYKGITYFNNETFLFFLINTKKLKFKKVIYYYKLYGRMK